MIATRFIPLIVLVIYHAKSQITSTIPQSQPKQLQSNYIHSCCKIDYDNDSDNNNTTQSSTNTLNKCMNESSNKHTADILQTVQSSDNIPRVGIISFATTDIWSYSTFSSSVHQAYAENNNYIYQSYHDSSLYDTNDMRWVKVKIIEEAIHPELGRARNMKYVMWIDADALIVDMNLRIEKVFDDYPEAHFIACAGMIISIYAMFMCDVVLDLLSLLFFPSINDF